MREIAEKRTLHSKTHDLENGQHRLVASMIPMHYEEAGQLLDIDMTIHNGVVNSGLYKVELITDKIGFHAIDRGSGKRISVSLNKVGNQNVAYSAPVINGNKASWPNLFQDLDVEFIFNPHQVNIFRVLKSSQAAKQVEWEVEEELGDKTIKMNNKIRGRDNAKNETKHTVVITPPEKNEQRKSYIIRDTFDDIVYKRNPQTRVKEESADVSYPVSIDPTVSITITTNSDDGYAFKRKLAGATTASGFSVSRTNEYIKLVTSNGNPLQIRDSRGFFRFPGITIPQSSTINSATINPWMVAVNLSPIAIVQAKKLNNPNAPTNVAGVFGGTLATAQATKTLTTASGARGSINVATVVQELVNTFDYSNQAMLFFIKQSNQGTQLNSIHFYIEDVFPGLGHAAQLSIDYTSGGSSSIKTWDGLADASVKTVNGLARASVKTRNGLS